MSSNKHALAWTSASLLDHQPMSPAGPTPRAPAPGYNFHSVSTRFSFRAQELPSPPHTPQSSKAAEPPHHLRNQPQRGSCRRNRRVQNQGKCKNRRPQLQNHRSCMQNRRCSLHRKSNQLPFKAKALKPTSPLENWNFTERAKLTALTVMVFSPKARGCALPLNQLPLATVLTTL